MPRKRKPTMYATFTLADWQQVEIRIEPDERTA